MTFISNKLNKNCVYEKSNILDVLNVFESTGINLALVINKNKEFVGVISFLTSGDLDKVQNSIHLFILKKK